MALPSGSKANNWSYPMSINHNQDNPQATSLLEALVKGGISPPQAILFDHAVLKLQRGVSTENTDMIVTYAAVINSIISDSSPVEAFTLFADAENKYKE
jgi:hypothetical protein